MTSTSGVAAIEARMQSIQSRFEPLPVADHLAEPSSTGSVGATDFGQIMAMLEASGADSTLTSGYGSFGIGGPILAARMAGSSIGAGRGDAVVNAATEYLGVPYLWGGTNPGQGLDCSGFVQRVHRDLGIELPRVSRDQARGGQPVASLAEARPGDVLAFGQPVNHVAIYLGDGQMIHAPRRGDVVKIEAIDRPITGIRRYTGGSSPVASPTAAYGAMGGFGVAASYGTGPINRSGAVSSVPFAQLFNIAGARHGVDPRLLASVAQVESNFNPNAVSRAGAQGLMQFMPGTARGMGIDPLDPAQAIDGAARYLRQQIDTFGSVELALAAYNAGPGAVQRHGGIPPYAETQAYVPKVLAAMNGVR